MKRWLMILFILAIVVIFPPLGILILVVYFLYKIYPKLKKNNNDFGKLKTFLESIVRKDIRKINLKENIEVSELAKHIYLLKRGNKYTLICMIHVPEIKLTSFKILEDLEGVYYIMKGNDLNILIAEEFLAFRLSETILKAKTLKLLNKLEILTSSLVSNNINISLVEPKLMAW